MMSVKEVGWLCVYLADEDEEAGPQQVGTDVALPAPSEPVHVVLRRCASERNTRGVRSRSDWHCLCVLSGFSKRAGPQEFRRQLASTVPPKKSKTRPKQDRGPAGQLLQKIAYLLLLQRDKYSNVVLTF